MEAKYQQLKSLVNCLDDDYKKFSERKIKVSGNRLRNSLLSCKKLCDELRKDIITEIKAIPVKKRGKAPQKEPETTEVDKSDSSN
jgi:hypothetical protein